jgi:hypothetical protein
MSSSSSSPTKNMIEYVYLCKENHPDGYIVAAFHTEEAAEAYCSKNLTTSGRPMYYVLQQYMNDYVYPTLDDDE